MLKEDIKNIKSGKEELRKFGLTLGIFLGLLGVFFLWRGKDFYIYFLVLSTAFIIFGLVLPLLLKPVQKGWMTIAIIIGWFMTRMILGFLFYLVFTLVRFLAMLSGKQFLDLTIDESKKSYWIHRESKELKKIEYEKQF